MSLEREYQINPIVPESVMHNSRVLSNLQSITASLFGVAAGILGLESYTGFVAYLVMSLLTAVLFYFVQVAPESTKQGRGLFNTSLFFHAALDYWTSGILNGFSGFVLTWTLFYGLVRA